MFVVDNFSVFFQWLFLVITGISAFTVIVLVGGILYVLINASGPAMGRFGIVRFLSSTDWDPALSSTLTASGT